MKVVPVIFVFLIFVLSPALASIPSDCVPENPPSATAEIHGRLNCPELDSPEEILPKAVILGPFEPGLYQIEIISRSCIDYGATPEGKLYGGRLRIQLAGNNQAQDRSEFYYVGYGSIGQHKVSHECSRIWEKTQEELNPVVVELSQKYSYIYVTPDDSFGGFCGDNLGQETIQIRKLNCQTTKSLPSKTATVTTTVTPTVTVTATPTVPATGTRTPSPTQTITSTPTPTPNWALELGLREGDVIGVPNPAINQPVRIWIPLESAARLKVTVYALTGEKVWGTQFRSQAGNASVLWEGINRAGEAVSGGLYIVTVEIQRPGKRKVYTTRIALVK